MDLFDQNLSNAVQTNAPLADRLRPQNLDDYAGQEEIIGPGTLLRQAIQTDEVPSMVFWGPPGCGKTTLAKIIASQTGSHFIELSAVTAGVKDLRQIILESRDRLKFHNKKTILFIDEIHRWNKSQQDGLLPHVENGTITLIGATTENPSFEVNAPLLSRLRVYVLKSLDKNALAKIITKALTDEKRGLAKYQIKLDTEALDFLIASSGGDARTILNALEVAAKSNPGKTLDKKTLADALQHRVLKYDKGGDEHYNIISAFIKSMRGSSVDGALYWLARMLEAGEDPKFIARRMVILASEDISNADPQALVIANAVFSAVEKIGLPECQLNLAQGVVYLAQAPKSNASYMAILMARQIVKQTGELPVPLHLRNAPTQLMKDLEYGKDYKYSHDYSAEEGKQDYLPEKIKGQKIYQNPSPKK